MRSRSIALVGLRLLAIYWAVHSFEAWGHLAALFVPDLPWSEIQFSSVFFATLIPGATQGVVALVLWLSAPRVASAVADETTTDDGNAPLEASAERWRESAISLAGIVLAAAALPGLASAVYQLTLPAAQGFDLNVYQLYLSRGVLIEKVAQTLLGVALALGSRPIARLLAKLRLLPG